MGVSDISRHDETPSGKTLQFPGATSKSRRHDKTPIVTARGSSATQSATQGAPVTLPSDPAFAIVAKAWDRLPEAIRQGVLAMVKASSSAHE
jgi:hypothetical protein